MDDLAELIGLLFPGVFSRSFANAVHDEQRQENDPHYNKYAYHIQWNLNLSFPQQLFSRMYRSPFLVPN